MRLVRALLATALALVAGLVLAWAARLQQGWRRGVAARAPLAIGALGYALPGTVLAIALLGPLGVLDAGLGHAAASLGVSPPALLVGSLSALALACTLRFLAIAAGGLEAGLARIAPALDDAARSLGASPARAPSAASFTFQWGITTSSRLAGSSGSAQPK